MTGPTPALIGLLRHRTAPVLFAVPLLLPHPSPAQEVAWEEVDWQRPITRGIRHVLFNHYNRPQRGTFSMTQCSPDTGDICFGGDHEDRSCRAIPECRPPFVVEYFLDNVRGEAADHPDDPHTIAQAVYAFSRLGRHLSAIELALDCATAEWWCRLVLGMAYHRAGREGLAEAHFRQGLRHADPELACRLTSVDELLADFDQRIYDDLPCTGRMEFAERFWWLSDPMLSIPGNDRWAEHINRRFELLLHERLVEAAGSDIAGALGGFTRRHPHWHEARVVRRGFEDSWSIARGMFRSWSSLMANRYRFTPVPAISWGFDSLRYELEAGEDDEGYTPTDYGPFFELPAQFARFRNGDSMVVVAAAQLHDTPLDPAGAGFFASDGPNSFPAVAGPVEGEARPTFSTHVPRVPLLVGIEAIDERGAAARVRRGLLPLGKDGLGLSDPLMIRASNGDMPENRGEAVDAMRGSTTIDHGDELVVYWEVYGLQPGRRTEVSVSIAGAPEGLLTRILRALRGAGGPAAPVVTWVERVSGAVHPMAVAIDIGSLEDGHYELRVAVSGPAGSMSASVRRFEVDRRY